MDICVMEPVPKKCTANNEGGEPNANTEMSKNKKHALGVVDERCFHTSEVCRGGREESVEASKNQDQAAAKKGSQREYSEESDASEDVVLGHGDDVLTSRSDPYNQEQKQMRAGDIIVLIPLDGVCLLYKSPFQLGAGVISAPSLDKLT